MTTPPPASGAGPAHYGDPLGEQRRWLAGAGMALLACDVVQVAGPERLDWLNLLTTQHLAGLPVGASAEALILDPRGHIVHAVGVADDGAATWLLTAPGRGADLAAWLATMRFRAAVEVSDLTSACQVIATPTPSASASLPPALITWTDPWPGVVEGGTRYAADAAHPGHGRHLTCHVLPAGAAAPPPDVGRLAPQVPPPGVGVVGLVPQAPVPGVGSLALEVPSFGVGSLASEVPSFGVGSLASEVSSSGAGVGSLALEALRIAAWRPALDREVDGRSLPHELDWLRTAVHLRKGCYPGQETVAKVHNTGHPPRRLVMLHLDGSAGQLPAPGALVTAEDVVVGRLTSVAEHFELGPIALALITRTCPETTTLTVEPAQRADQVQSQVQSHGPGQVQVRGLGPGQVRGQGYTQDQVRVRGQGQVRGQVEGQGQDVGQSQDRGPASARIAAAQVPIVPTDGESADRPQITRPAARPTPLAGRGGLLGPGTGGLGLGRPA